MAQQPPPMQRLSSSDGSGPAPSARLAAARAELARIEAEAARAASADHAASAHHTAPADNRAPADHGAPADDPGVLASEAAPAAAAEAAPESDDEPCGDRRASARGSSRARKADVPREDDPARAYDACLRLLGDRARSRGELAERLARREFSPATIDAVLSRLDREGLIDDADFADQWVHFRHRDGGKAKRALAQELRQKGVADELVANALEQISGDDEAQRAAELVRRKLTRRVVDPEMDRAQREKEIRRLVGMLARKGYSPGLAYTVVKAEWNAAAGQD